MPFSIISTDRGVAEVRIEGPLDEATMYILRVELATLLRRLPERVELWMHRPSTFDHRARASLFSFAEILHAHHGSLVLRSDESPAVVVSARDIERHLTASHASSGPA